MAERVNQTRRRRTSPLEYGAIAFVVLVCLAIAWQDANNLLRQRRDVWSDAGKDATNLSRSLARHASDILRTADASIIGVVRRLEFDGVDSARLEQLSRIMTLRLAMFPGLGDWAVTDDKGKCLIAGHPSPTADCAATYAANLDYHRQHPGDEAYLGKPFWNEAADSWILPFSHRFNRSDGSFGGIVVAGISLDYFQQFYDSFSIGERGAILLATRDGTLLVRRPHADRNVGRDLHNSTFFREYVAKSAAGYAETVSATDGVTRLNSYSPVEGYPLIVSVALASDEVLAPWREEAETRVVRTGILIVVIGLLGFGLARYIRRHQRLENAYHEATEAFRLLAENSSDLIVKMGAHGKREYVSPAVRSLLGYEPEELLGRSTGEIVYPPDRAIWEEAFGPAADDSGADVQATYRVLRKNGTPIWIEVNRRSLPRNEGYVIVTRDVTRRKQAEDQLTEANRQLEDLAHRDGLTGLANRRHFDEVLNAEFARARREGTVLSLIMIDVDCFKLFNDRYGHPGGDHCLQEIAGVLAKLPGRPGDLVARYGGEEMVIILPNTAPPGALNVAERAREAVRGLAMPHEGNAPKIVTISLGVASAVPGVGIATPEQLVDAADGALYAAKKTGRDRACQADLAIAAPATAEDD